MTLLRCSRDACAPGPTVLFARGAAIRLYRAAVAMLLVGAVALPAGRVWCADLPDQLQTEFGPAGPAGPPAPGPGGLFGGAEDPWRRIPRGTGERFVPYAGLGRQPLAPGVYETGMGYPSGFGAAYPSGFGPLDQRAMYGEAYAQYGLEGGYGAPTRRRMYRDKLEISGSASASFRRSSVQGAQALYDSQFIDTKETDQQAAVYFDGRLTDGFYISGQLRSSPYQPTHSDYALTYHRSSFDVTYGDLSIRLTNSPFASFYKSVRGVQVLADIGDQGQCDLYVADQRGRVRKDVIPGEGHSGPYRLSYTPIREGTERVRLDGRTLTQAQYNLDPDSGFLYFENNMVIPPTSVIEVTYEEDRPGLAGRLIGFQATGSIGSVPLGFTMVRQEAARQTTGGRQSVEREERFFGNNSVGPFTLSYRPIDLSRPITVLVDGVPKQAGIDYDFNPGGGTIFFRQVVSAMATVVIRYYSFDEPDVVDTTRTVIGIDTGFSFSQGGVAINYGRSSGGTTQDGSPAPSGQAFAVRGQATLLHAKLAVDPRWVTEPPPFRRTESASFQRDRSGTDALVSFRPTEGVTLTYMGSQDVSSEGLTLGASDPFATGGATSTGFDFRTTQDSLGVQIQRGSLPSITLGLDNNTTSQIGGAYSALTSRRITVSDSFGNLSVGAGYDRADRRSTRTTSAQDGAQTDQTTQALDSIATEQLRTDASYHWGEGNSVGIGYSRNRTIDPTGQGRDSSGEATVAQLNYALSEKILISGGRRFTRSLGAVFISGMGYPGGYQPSPGYSGPISGRQDAEEPSFTQAATTDDSTDAQISAQLSDKLTLSGRYSDRLYDTEGGVGYLAANRTRSWGASLYYQPSDSLTLGGDVDFSRTLYLDRRRAELSSEGYRFNVDYRASEKLSLGFGWSLINATSPSFSGGASSGGLTVISSTSYASYSFQAMYNLSSKDLLSFDADYTQSRAAVDDNDRWSLNLTYDRQLTRLLWLGAHLRYVNFNDRLVPTTAAGSRDYRATQFAATLNVRF